MSRRIWRSGPGILLCCVIGLGLLFFSPAVANELEDIYIPVILDNFPAKDPVLRGSLHPEDLGISSLAEDTADLWTMDLLAGDRVTITVAPGNSADIMLSLFDKKGLVHQQNLSPAGEVETGTDLNITKTEEHELLVQSVRGQPTDYAIMFLDQDSYSFVFRGKLDNNDSREDSLPPDADHFWFFNVLQGQAVSFRITPDSNSDPYIELYGPHGGRVLTIDDNAIGEPESLVGYTLLDSGLYAIRVAEFDFQAMDYRIALSIQ